MLPIREQKQPHKCFITTTNQLLLVFLMSFLRHAWWVFHRRLQVQRHTQATAILCNFFVLFLPIWGHRWLTAWRFRVVCVYFSLWKCAFHRRTQNTQSIDVLETFFFFFQDHTPPGEHPDPMPMRGNTLKRVFSWKHCSLMYQPVVGGKGGIWCSRVTLNSQKLSCVSQFTETIFDLHTSTLFHDSNSVFIGQCPINSSEIKCQYWWGNERTTIRFKITVVFSGSN